MEVSKDNLFSFSTGALAVSTSVITCVWVYRRWVNKSYYWDTQNIPSSKPLPYIGNLWSNWRKPFHEVDMNRYREFGPICGTYLGETLCLNVGDPVFIQEILGQHAAFGSRGIPLTGNELLDSMLPNLRGEDWRRVRGVITRTFTPRKIRRVMPIFQACGWTVVQNFRTACEQGRSVDVKEFYGTFAVDVIAKAAFSTRIDAYNDPNNTFVQHAKRIFRSRSTDFVLIHLLPESQKKLWKINLNNMDSIEFFQRKILEIIEERERFPRLVDDFLTLLMESANELTREELERLRQEQERQRQQQGEPQQEQGEPQQEQGEPQREGQQQAVQQQQQAVQQQQQEVQQQQQEVQQQQQQQEVQQQQQGVQQQGVRQQRPRQLSMNEVVAQCVAFFMAGYDTTGSTLAFASYMLALNQDVQDRLREEVDDTLNQIEGENKVITYDLVEGMSYLKNVIDETLRFFPPAAQNARLADIDYESNFEFRGQTIKIPTGTIINFPVYAIHHDEKYYQNPEVFNPDRFHPNSEEMTNRPSAAFIPFGGGARKCVGERFARMEISVCLIQVIANFKLKRARRTRVPLKFKATAVGLMQPKDVIIDLEIRTDGPFAD